MGIYTFVLYLLTFGEIIYAEEITEKEYRRTSIFSGSGMIIELLLWVVASIGSLTEAFTLFCWISFGYFSVVTGFLYMEIRKEFLPNHGKENDKNRKVW